MEEKLTPRERDVLNFILQYRRENGMSPTWREIADGIYIESHVGIQRYLIALCEKGYIRMIPRIPRSIVLEIEM